MTKISHVSWGGYDKGFYGIQKLKITKHLIVYIDEWTFSPSSLTLYSWMKKGEPAARVIRETTNRYNSIIAQWSKNVYLKKILPMKKVYEISLRC